MKSTIFTVALLIIAFCAACAAGKPGSVTSIAAAASDGNTAQALIQIERDWINAMLNRDTAKLEQILAPNFRHTDPDGNQFTRMQTTDELKSGALKFDAFELNEINVQFYQDAAVVFGTYTYRGNYQGHAFDEHVRCTDFFVKQPGQDGQNGRWIAAASQASRLPK